MAQNQIGRSSMEGVMFVQGASCVEEIHKVNEQRGIDLKLEIS